MQFNKVSGGARESFPEEGFGGGGEGEEKACHTGHGMWQVREAQKKRGCVQTSGYCGGANEEKPGLNWGVLGGESEKRGCSQIVISFYCLF